MGCNKCGGVRNSAGGRFNIAGVLARHITASYRDPTSAVRIKYSDVPMAALRTPLKVEVAKLFMCKIAVFPSSVSVFCFVFCFPFGLVARAATQRQTSGNAPA